MLSIYFSSRDLSACPIREGRFSKCLGGWKAAAPAGRISERGRRDRQQNNSSLNEEPGTISRQKKYGKSYKCSGEPSAPEKSDKKSEGLPRSPVKAFSLRQGRCDEGAVLGVSRP
jgi:hypothetical protein